MDKKLKELIEEWKLWAKKADNSYDGWESGFPEWDQLINQAEFVMSNPRINQDDLELVDFCWKISEESEDLSEIARANPENYLVVVESLTRSKDPQVRWQAFDVIGFTSGKFARAEAILNRGLGDEDNYVRRRSILALAKLKPKNVRAIIERFIKDRDPYIRQATFVLAKSSDDKILMERVREILINDPVEHVCSSVKEQ